MNNNNNEAANAAAYTVDFAIDAKDKCLSVAFADRDEAVEWAYAFVSQSRNEGARAHVNCPTGHLLSWFVSLSRTHVYVPRV